MDTRSFSPRTCLVYSLILLIACGRITSAQVIYQEKPSVALDMATILQIILNRAPVVDRAQTQAPTTTTTTTTTKTAEQFNYLNEDGSVNRNRAGLLPFATPAPKPADRNIPAMTYLDILLRRFPFAQATVKPTVNGYRSYDQTSAPASPAAPASSAVPSSHETSTTSTTTKKNGALVVTNGGVFIVNNGSGKTPSTKEEKIDIQDKPYTAVPDDFFENKTRSKRSVQDDEPEALNAEDPSCLSVGQFEPCHYYASCFAKSDEYCGSRNSYIGDETYKLCLAAQSVVNSTVSQPLKSYLYGVEGCIKGDLVGVLESPSCDDVTTTPWNALLSSQRTSCLYLDGRMCDVIADPAARRDLASLFSDPLADREFRLRLLINLGEMTLYCPGEDAILFVTDLMVQVMSSHRTTNRITESSTPTVS